MLTASHDECRGDSGRVTRTLRPSWTAIVTSVCLLSLIAGGSASAAEPEPAATMGKSTAAPELPPLVDGLMSVPGEVIVTGVGASFLAAIESPPPPAETIEYYAIDAIGSTRVVFAPDGTVLGRGDYLPFGEELPGANLPPEHFTGQARDTEAGLDYFKARQYQPRLGRFPSTDPLFAGAVENPQRWNRYAYALNNPITFSDPDGRLACTGSGYYADGHWYSDDNRQCENGPGGGGGGGGVVSLFPNDPGSFNVGGDYGGAAHDPGGRGVVVPPPPALTGTPGGEAPAAGDPPIILPGKPRSQFDLTMELGAFMNPMAAGVEGAGMLARLAQWIFGGDRGAAEVTTLYRAMSFAEYNELMETGRFAADGGASMEAGKWFAESAADAATWGEKMSGAGSFCILCVEFPAKDAAQFIRYERLDSIGPARFGTLEQLNGSPFVIRPHP